MFENETEVVESLLATDEEFRDMYQRHQNLKSQVRDADLGVLPLDQLTVERMKKEKLMLKDKMAVKLKQAQA
ncbi:MAG: YdcH family protein [Magnetococcales bacterium]|nr:YdcH family protein [Magnetococcales bacterium]NGZ28583.1 YdcH family protein [Magnetococcales bacterium]